MSARDHHLRLPAERLRIRGDARRTPAALADTVIVNTCAVTAEAERQARQAIRRARRERPGGAHHGDGLRRPDRPRRASRRCPRSTRCSATWRSSGRRAGRRTRRARVARHHGGARDGGASGRRSSPAGRAPSCRCSRAAIIAAPSASSRSAAARAAACRWARWSSRCARWSRAGYPEVVLTGVDITAYGRICRDGRRFGAAGAPPADAGARTAPAAALLAGPGRDRRPISGA